MWFVFVKPSCVLLYVFLNVKFWKTHRMLKQLRQIAVSAQNAEGMHSSNDTYTPATNYEVDVRHDFHESTVYRTVWQMIMKSFFNTVGQRTLYRSFKKTKCSCC